MYCCHQKLNLHLSRSSSLDEVAGQFTIIKRSRQGRLRACFLTICITAFISTFMKCDILASCCFSVILNYFCRSQDSCTVVKHDTTRSYCLFYLTALLYDQFILSTNSGRLELFLYKCQCTFSCVASRCTFQFIHNTCHCANIYL